MRQRMAGVGSPETDQSGNSLCGSGEGGSRQTEQPVLRSSFSACPVRSQETARRPEGLQWSEQGGGKSRLWASQQLAVHTLAFTQGKMGSSGGFSLYTIVNTVTVKNGTLESKQIFSIYF